jgi:hypothetical protein
MEAERRGIDTTVAESVVSEPQQRLVEGRRIILQSRYHDRVLAKEMLLRVVIESKEEAVKIITVYRTSRIRKYWQP